MSQKQLGILALILVLLSMSPGLVLILAKCSSDSPASVSSVPFDSSFSSDSPDSSISSDSQAPLKSPQTPQSAAAIREFPPETLALWLSLEPACTFSSSQGMEYRLVGVDQAAGSTYYVLLGTSDEGKTCSFLNPDPFNGSGGTAKWITFLDEKLGFSCLAHSGGSYGCLYRTQDGGKTFCEVEYPSAMVTLPDGNKYNPFVMPEKVYEEDGQLYLLAGQGPEGDYYSENGWCQGLYSSTDLGKTWVYIKDIPAADSRN